MNEHEPFCREPVCDACGWCTACERYVGTPHLPVCACPPETPHTLCRNCHAKFVAWSLTATEHEQGHWWDDALADRDRHIPALAATEEPRDE